MPSEPVGYTKITATDLETTWKPNVLSAKGKDKEESKTQKTVSDIPKGT